MGETPSLIKISLGEEERDAAIRIYKNQVNPENIERKQKKTWKKPYKTDEKSLEMLYNKR